MALIKSENVETNKYQVEISVDAKTFNDACERSYKKNVKKINVPGFRRGKAPRKMIERMYGESIFYDDAIEMVYPSALSDAIKEAELDVVGVEKLEPGEISAEKGLTFTATCIVKPDIELEGYKGLKITHTVHTVSAADVNKELKQMQERNGREITVDDRPVKKNDTVVFDFDGMIDGKRFEGGKAERHTLQVGSGMFIPGFEDQIVGLSLIHIYWSYASTSMPNALAILATSCPILPKPMMPIVFWYNSNRG